jgi:hypothetical protein
MLRDDFAEVRKAILAAESLGGYGRERALEAHFMETDQLQRTINDLTEQLVDLRQIAQAVVEAVAFYDSMLGSTLRAQQLQHVMETARGLRAVLNEATR